MIAETMEQMREHAEAALMVPVVWTSAGELVEGDRVVERFEGDKFVRYAALEVTVIIDHRLEAKRTLHLSGEVHADFYGMCSTDPVLIIEPVMRVLPKMYDGRSER